MSIRHIKNNLCQYLKGHNTKMHNRLQEHLFLFFKCLPKLYLKLPHLQGRMDWAQKYMLYRDKWLTILFTYKNKRNQDGPDDWNCYWNGLGK